MRLFNMTREIEDNTMYISAKKFQHSTTGKEGPDDQKVRWVDIAEISLKMLKVVETGEHFFDKFHNSRVWWPGALVGC